VPCLYVVNGVMSASARTTAGGGIALQFPYREALVDDLKQEIPPRFRHWDRDAKCWLILGAYAPAAVDLLLSHYPHAEIPPSYGRQSPAMVIEVAPPLPVLEPHPHDQPPLDPLVAIISCPRCGERHERPVRVVAQAAETVAKNESITPELTAICPSCRSLIVLAFWPAAAAATVALRPLMTSPRRWPRASVATAPSRRTTSWMPPVVTASAPPGWR
jgi:hypothetical protein